MKTNIENDVKLLAIWSWHVSRHIMKYTYYCYRSKNCLYVLYFGLPYGLFHVMNSKLWIIKKEFHRRYNIIVFLLCVPLPILSSDTSVRGSRRRARIRKSVFTSGDLWGKSLSDAEFKYFSSFEIPIIGCFFFFILKIIFFFVF